MLRGGTSRGLYFEAERPARRPGRARRPAAAADGHARPAPDRRPGRRHPLTSKVAVVQPLGAPGRRRRLPVPAARRGRADGQRPAELRQHPGRGRAVRGRARAGRRAGRAQTTVRIRMVNSDSVAVATFPTPAGGSSYRGDAAIAGVPGTAAPVALDVHRTPRARPPARCCPPATCGTCVDGIEVTCVDNGMPVVAGARPIVRADRLRDAPSSSPPTRRCWRGSTRSGSRPGQLMGLGDVAASSVPKTVPGRAGPGRRRRSCTRAFIPVQPHTAIGVLAAVSVVTGLLLPGAVGHELTADWPPDGVPDRRRAPDRPPARRRRRRRRGRARRGSCRSGVVRTARKLFDGDRLPSRPLLNGRSP